jgi:hypothetical protein
LTNRIGSREHFITSSEYKVDGVQDTFPQNDTLAFEEAAEAGSIWFGLKELCWKLVP